ncbi:hypothetical protein PUNSTDRAFT_130524 [Punctularia strigosozonata HHB-11173 SS5]|uniref:uncharacterized protein n=1 Tax=Punctularia strigosozonata (strain HHB-11173) TaxID=741275 RepID=UPI0004416CDE|nr:uncharacterized protein PUNSTDRAFT_130524 [Punctularia strigosozonata HHB-11173 SS5]EIN12257.1 hypothetical protein PUNSTDRAFT_130524 [Punctularia strigosozonata HHB-11173 SS5]
MIHLDSLSGVLHFACQYLHIILPLTPFVSSDCSAHRTPRAHNRPASSLVESISSSAMSSSDRLSEAEETPSVSAQSGQDVKLEAAWDRHESCIECMHPWAAQADVDRFERRVYDATWLLMHRGRDLGSLSTIADLYNLQDRGIYLHAQIVDVSWPPELPIKLRNPVLGLFLRALLA